MNVLAIIPARGGSKGVKKKNLHLLNGSPLIDYTFETARKSCLLTKVVVSTDCSEIAEYSKSRDIEVVERPAELAGDLSLVVDAIKYTVNKLEENDEHYDVILLLEPTSPLRSDDLIDRCIRKFEDKSVESVATFVESHISPNRLWKLENDTAKPYINGAVPWLPRQQQPVSWELNGLVYGFRRSNLKNDDNQKTFLTDKIVPVLTKAEESIDIDTYYDFAVAEALLKWRDKDE